MGSTTRAVSACTDPLGELGLTLLAAVMVEADERSVVDDAGSSEITDTGDDLEVNVDVSNLEIASDDVFAK